MYQGKRLSEWAEVRQSELSHIGVTDPEVTSADGPLQRIGTNGLPILIKWLRYEDPKWMTVMYRLTDRLPQIAGQEAFHLLIRPTQRAQLAEMTICALGPGATNAIPALCAIMNDPEAVEASVRAISVLADLGSAALPPLLIALADPKHPNRADIVGGIGGMGTNALPAIPALLCSLREKDLNIVKTTIRALARLNLEPETVVPALAQGLTNGSYDIQTASAAALMDFGEAAKPSVPALVQALDDPDHWVRTAAEQALEKIAVEELVKDKRTRTHKPPTVFHRVD